MLPSPIPFRLTRISSEMNPAQNPPMSLPEPDASLSRPLHVQDLHLAGFVTDISARLYRPETSTADSGALPVVLYFHGGGFVGGALEDADVPARHIAQHARVAVLSVAYSLAPEHPFPVAPEDAHAAAIWLVQQAKALQLDPQRLAAAGDDAGGNITAALALMARDRNGPSLRAQVLIGPMLDPSMSKLGDASVLKSELKPETCAACYSKYLPRLLQRLHPYASPLASRRLAGLPPALIVTAECDVLHKEAEQYAAELIAAGVPTQAVRFNVQHRELHRHPPLLDAVAEFLHRQLHPH